MRGYGYSRFTRSGTAVIADRAGFIRAVLLAAAVLTLATVTMLHAAEASRVVFSADTFAPAGDAAPPGWSTMSFNEAKAPRFFVAPARGPGGEGALAVGGNSELAANGCWYTDVGVTPGGWYSLEAFYRGFGVDWPDRQAVARVDWLDSSGSRVSRPEYALRDAGDRGDWMRYSGLVQAPEDAATARLQFFLRHCPRGTAWWDRITLREAREPQPRMVRLAAADCRPTTAQTNMGMAEQFVGVIEEAGRRGCDILLLGETITLPARGNVPAMEKAETIPGPITERFGELAREYSMYIIVGLLENENGVLHNTAALIDRQGRVAGKYRKVHMPLEDIESGVVPGDDYPVFDTDFGRIGIMICYDVQFDDPARALALRGAEVIFLPNWGNRYPMEARSGGNRVWVVSSGYDTPTDIYDPRGERIAVSEKRPGLAVADVDLNMPLRDRGLRIRRARFMFENRPDIEISR